MRVRIEDMLVFECQDLATYKELRRLFERASRGQHLLEVDDPELVLGSNFNSRASAEIDQQEWEELLRRTSVNPFAVMPQGQRYAVVGRYRPLRDPRADFYVATAELGDWAEQPLSILLENTRDEVLVKLAVSVSDPDSPIRQAFEKGWLVAAGCGGCGEVLNALRKASSSERLFAVIDSDRETSDGNISPTAAQIELTGTERRTKVHILNRRELENYVPEMIWTALVPPSKKKPAGDRGKQRKAAKVVDVYRWLARQLSDARHRLVRLHGEDAVDKTAADIESKAERRIPIPLAHERLLEWRKMSPTQRVTDDLKVRFGKSCAEAAVIRLSDSDFENSNLDTAALAELRQIAQEIEEWL